MIVRSFSMLTTPLRRAVLSGLLLALWPVCLAAAQPLPNADLQAAYRSFVSHEGVDYAAWKASPKHRAALDRFVAAAADMPRAAPLSDWLNVYNAVVIHQVLAHYPIKSVMDVPGFFKKTRYRIAGADRTLDDLEHKVIRPRFRDARVHMALNCGAVSCPALSPRLFAAQGLSKRLAQITRQALGKPRHVRYREGKLELSAIFFWFADDFVGEAGSVRAWIERHGPPGRLAAVPASVQAVQRSYDWRLNQKK